MKNFLTKIFSFQSTSNSFQSLQTGNWKLKTAAKRPGYTLLEMMVSVLIFSGLIILAIAAFARSASSGTRSNSVRVKVEAARSVIDQLTNDFHYVDTVDQVASFKTTCGGTSEPFIGLRLGGSLGCDEAELLLKYPGATGNGDLVWRLYSAQTLGGRPSIYVYEQRGLSVCNDGSGNIITNVINPCTSIIAPTTPADLVKKDFVADGLGGLTPVFSGQDIANAKIGNVTPSVKIHFVMKPASYTSQSCDALAEGTCYTLDTTVIPGSI